METAIKVLPLQLYGFVILQLKVALGKFISIADIVGKQVGKQEGIDTFVLILRRHGYKHEVNDIVVALDGLEQMIPTGGEQFAATLLQSRTQRWHRDTHTYELAVGIDYNADAVEAKDSQIMGYIVVNLLVGERRIAIEVFICLVDKMKEGVAKLGGKILYFRKMESLQSIFLAHDIGNAEILIGHLVGNGHAVFDPIDIFGIASALHVDGIVSVVVDGGYRAELVESKGKHTFVVHVGEAHRAYHLGHALASSPIFGCIHKRIVDLGIVDKLNPSEARFLMAALLVDPMVDNCSDAAYRLTIAIGHKELSLTELKGRIFGGIESVYLVEYQRWNVAGVIFI